ncbi:MAG: radical SAM protein [Thermoplasmata archaeon]|nr:radical SAM protein [Thermoplasmata archaeon]
MNKAFSELSIELTHRCALNCVYCSSNASIDNYDCIEYNNLIRTIKEAKKEFGVNVISLSGGETLLYPFFWDLYSFLVEEELEILIYTSGIIENQDGERAPISKDIAKRLLVGGGNPKVFLNVQGHHEDLTERINGVSGSFRLIENSIDALSSQGLSCGAHIVPFKMNYEYIEEIYDYCLSKSFGSVNFLRFVPQGRGSDLGLYNSKSEFAEVNRTLGVILKKNKTNGTEMGVRLGHPIDFQFLTKSDSPIGDDCENHCRAGSDAPLILPSGDVILCPAWKGIEGHVAGNIYTQTLSEIWRSSTFNTIREFVKKDYKNMRGPCKSCTHLDRCRGKCIAQRLMSNTEALSNADLEDRLLWGPDPQCFRLSKGED